jgi:aconitate hydratase
VLPLTFVRAEDGDDIQLHDVLHLSHLDRIGASAEMEIENATQHKTFRARHTLSPRQVEILLCGGLINWMKRRL